MSLGTILDLSHGPALNEDNNSEDVRVLEACDAFARSQVAGSLQDSGLEVVGAFRDETSAMLAAPNRAAPRRALLASSSPRPSVSLSSSHGARRSCKRDFAVSDASSAEHWESLSLRQHRRRREEVKFLGAHGTTTPREAWPGPEAAVSGTSSQAGRIFHSFGKAAHALSLEYGPHVERRAALQAELQRLARQHAAVVAILTWFISGMKICSHTGAPSPTALCGGRAPFSTFRT